MAEYAVSPGGPAVGTGQRDARDERRTAIEVVAREHSAVDGVRASAMDTARLAVNVLLASLLHEHDVELVRPASLDPSRPLPMTFSPYRLGFRITPVAAPGGG